MAQANTAWSESDGAGAIVWWKSVALIFWIDLVNMSEHGNEEMEAHLRNASLALATTKQQTTKCGNDGVELLSS